MTHRQILLVLSGLMLGLFLAALDQTIVATALPTIAGELGGLEHLSWVVTAYLLTSTASAPLYGKVSDMYGRKIVFQFAIVTFLIGSVLAGMSQSMTQLIAFRAIQGLGAGGLIVMTFTIVGDIVSPRERGRYQGYIGAVFALASIAGPLLGGFFVDNFSWRWVFYINLPIGLAALFVTATVLNLPFRRVDHPVDYLGAGLLVGGVTSLLLVMVWGGSEYPWDSPMIIGLSVVAVVLLGLFLLQERRATEPILPLRLFRDRTFAITSAAGFIVGLGMFGGIIFLPLFLQVVMGTTPTNSGPAVAAADGWRRGLVDRLRAADHPHRPLQDLPDRRHIPHGDRSLAFLDHEHRDPIAHGIDLHADLRHGCRPGPAGAGDRGSECSGGARDLGVATSSATFFRSLGGSFGTALFGAVLTSQLAIRLASLLPEGAEMGELTGSPDLIAQLPAATREVGDGCILRRDNHVLRHRRPVRPGRAVAGRIPSRTASA